MRRLVLLAFVGWCLQGALAGADSVSPQDFGLRFDPRQLVAQGWRESREPADFPLRIEGKSENLLFGLVAPDGRARIFILYSQPMKPMAIDTIDVEPPQTLLARLGVRRHEASGGIEEGFISEPSLSAIHWTLTGPGNGVTFSGEAEPGEQTFSLRTILSLVVAGPGAERRPLLLTALLRCRPSEAEDLKRLFWTLLRTIKPAKENLRLISPEVAVAEAARQSQASTLRAAVVLLERELPSLTTGKELELSPDDRSVLEAVLKLLPGDPVAALLLKPAPGEAAATIGDKEAELALRAYLETALRVAKAMEQREWLQGPYQQILAVNPAVE